MFNTQTAEWVQSIGLKRSRPLSNQGNLAITFINDLPLVIYLANMHTSKFIDHWNVYSFQNYDSFIDLIAGELLNTQFSDRDGRIKPKRRFSMREGNRTIRT